MNNNTLKCYRCNKNAVDFINNLWCCKTHKSAENIILTYKYPNDIKLNNLPDEIKITKKEQELFDSFNNYLNFKLSGLLISDEEISLVMMREPINPLSIAKFISKNVEWMSTRNDIYTFINTFDNLIIESILFDYHKNIYIINIKI
jgi:hypothetical protein